MGATQGRRDRRAKTRSKRQQLAADSAAVDARLERERAALDEVGEAGDPVTATGVLFVGSADGDDEQRSLWLTHRRLIHADAARNDWGSFWYESAARVVVVGDAVEFPKLYVRTRDDLLHQFTIVLTDRHVGTPRMHGYNVANTLWVARKCVEQGEAIADHSPACPECAQAWNLTRCRGCGHEATSLDWSQAVPWYSAEAAANPLPEATRPPAPSPAPPWDTAAFSPAPPVIPPPEPPL